MSELKLRPTADEVHSYRERYGCSFSEAIEALIKANIRSTLQREGLTVNDLNQILILLLDEEMI